MTPNWLKVQFQELKFAITRQSAIILMARVFFVKKLGFAERENRSQIALIPISATMVQVCVKLVI